MSIFKKFLNSKTGFTLIEVVAVIGVLAVTSAILITNNKLNNLQLSLNTDIAGVTNAISRAKALTLQGVGANEEEKICGYGVSFDQGLDDAPDTYTIYSYIDCKNWVKDDILSGQGGVNNFSKGLRILKLAIGEDSQFIRDIIFYSSDAKTKLFNFDDKSICMEIGSCDVISSAGIIVINTESMPTSFMTLKISTTGQVTSKPGAYSNVGNFDSGKEMIFTVNEDGSLSYIEDTEGESEDIEDGPTFGEDPNSCIPNCFCALSLPSGGTCSDGCDGICYAGNPGPCAPLPTDCQAPNNTCADLDSCGAYCAVCDVSNNYFCNTATKSCELCLVCPIDEKGDTCGGCFGNCKGCDGSGEGYLCTNEDGVWACRIGAEGTFKLETVFPPIGYK